MNLFNLPPSRPPESSIDQLARLLMEGHGILTHHSPGMPEPWLALKPNADLGDVGSDIGTIMARHCRLYDEAGWLAYGKTESEAVLKLGGPLTPRLLAGSKPISV
jgi:hypothetical protein